MSLTRFFNWIAKIRTPLSQKGSHSINLTLLVVTARSSGQQANSGIITLKLWRNGFTINDRELRTYDDPKNRGFLSAIKQGEVPIEIQQEIQGAEVRLDMEDHRSEEYIPSKVRLSAFSGKGHILGR